jgi:PAS domain S-box-containing protein
MDGELADDLYDASPHPVIAIDSDGQAVYANPATKHVFGLEPREVVGRSATMLIGLPNRAPWSAVLPRFTQDREAGPVGLEGDCTGTRSDGSEFPAEITILPAYRGDAVVVFATVVDLSYRDALRARLARQQGPVAP